MKIINFVSPCKRHRLLVHAIMAGFCFEQTKRELEYQGYYLPMDQYESFAKTLDIQLDLDIGNRRNEYGSKTQ